MKNKNAFTLIELLVVVSTPSTRMVESSANTEPFTSPVTPPVTLPVILPVTLPTRLPVTVPITASLTVKTPVPGLYLNVSSVKIKLSPV